MSSALVQPVATSQAAISAPPRILIVRSCRMAQLLGAVVLARVRNRAAEIVVLSHRGHRYLLRAAGADRVIEVSGRRFGLLRLAPWTLARLRSESFSEVIIPQMTARPDTHVNLYQMVAALRPAARHDRARGGAAPDIRRRALSPVRAAAFLQRGCGEMERLDPHPRVDDRPAPVSLHSRCVIRVW